MDADSNPSDKKKRRFAPGRPPSRPPTRPPRRTDADDEQTARTIASRFAIGQRKSKAEKKPSPEVALQPTSPSLSIPSFGVPKDDGKCSDSDLKGPQSGNVLPAVPSVTAQNDGEEMYTLDDDDALVKKTEKDYIEPWDYQNSYYPTVLPWRKPPSGDPELLNKEEFGEVARHRDYDENSINSAKELGLTTEDRGKETMFLFKIPDTLPMMRSADTKDRDNLNRSVSHSIRNNPFEGLPAGPMGKMLVYKSGAVKLKLGNILFDVSPGPSTNFCDDVAVINTRERHYCCVGSPAKIITVTPNIDSLLNSASDMETEK